jgi:hypothetical protein
LVRRPLFDLLYSYQSRMMDDNLREAIGGVRISRGNRSTRRKPRLVSLCTLQIRYDLSWAGTQAAAVGKRRLTAWAMARPSQWTNSHSLSDPINGRNLVIFNETEPISIVIE